MAKILSNVIFVTFISLLVKDFRNWKEFQTGIIDQNVNLKPGKKIDDKLRNFVRKMRMLLLRVAPNNNILKALVFFYLLRESKESWEGAYFPGISNRDVLKEAENYIPTDDKTWNQIKNELDLLLAKAAKNEFSI